MKSVFLICFIAFASTLFGQNVTFDQVQNLRKQSLADVETLLTAKGWKMTEAIEEEADKFGVVTFGYDLDMFDSEKAVSWIKFYTSSIGDEYNRISIQLSKTSIYTTFMSRLTANAYKLKSSKIADGGIKKVYQNATTTCVVTTTTVEGAYSKSTSYSFFFINNLSYKLNFETPE